MEALYIMSAICFLIGAACLFLSLWSRDPKHLGTAVGKLTESKKVMRYPYRHSTRKVPFTACVYLYEVNGKTYKLKRSGRFGRSTLLKRISVIYLKPFPRFGYPDEFPGGMFTMVGVFYLICAIWLLLLPCL